MYRTSYTFGARLLFKIAFSIDAEKQWKVHCDVTLILLVLLTLIAVYIIDSVHETHI